MEFIKIILILLLPISCFTQIEISNSSLVEPDRNILYIGINNRLEISGIEGSVNVELKSNDKNSHIYFSNGRYSIKPNPYNNAEEILTVLENGNIRHSEKFEVVKVESDLVATLGGLKDTVLTVQQILAKPTIGVYMPESLLKINFAVTRFNMSIKLLNGQIIRFPWHNRAYLRKEQLDAVKKLKSGDKIALFNMAADSPNSGSRSIQPIIFTLK